MPGEGSALGPYLRAIRDSERLSGEEERSLALEIAGGCPLARERMIRANLPLVVKLAAPFVGRGLPLEDLVAEGNLGLIRAIADFDPGHGTRLSTYAAHWIKQSIRQAILTGAGTVRTPSHVAGLLRRWRRSERALARRLGRAPTPEEVADDLGLSPRQRLMAARGLNATAHRSGPSGQEEGPGWLPEHAPDEGPGPRDLVESADDLQWLQGLLARLPERERRVLARRFGLEGAEALTLQEIAGEEGTTRESVRRLEGAAIRKLRGAIGPPAT